MNINSTVKETQLAYISFMFYKLQHFIHCKRCRNPVRLISDCRTLNANIHHEVLKNEVISSMEKVNKNETSELMQPWIRTYIDATPWGELAHAIIKLVLSNCWKLCCLRFREHPLSNLDGVLSSTWSHWQQGVCYLWALLINRVLASRLKAERYRRKNVSTNFEITITSLPNSMYSTLGWAMSSLYLHHQNLSHISMVELHTWG